MKNCYRNYFLFFALFVFGYSQFGKNIVQYDEFDWQFIQTKNFDIYYYNSSKNHAEFVAYTAEIAAKKLEKFLGWELSKRSDIFIYNSHNDFQQTNILDLYMEEGVGGVTELMKNRMVIPFDGSMEEFRHVIYHELVHVFINDGIYGGSLINMIKKGNVRIPLWMNEGLAEYIADPWNTNTEMWVRDLALNSQEIPHLKYLNGYLAYRGGQSAWSFITQKWGDESIADFFYNLKVTSNFKKSLKLTFGVTLDELSDQWHKYLKKQYWPDLDIRQDIRDISRQITNHEKLLNSYNFAPSISPDGLKAAIYSNKNGVMSIYIISMIDGEFLETITTGQVTSEYEELHILRPGISWSPNGKQIVFAAKSGESEALFIHDIDGTDNKIKKTFDIEGIYSPSWHHTKNIIAFIGNNGMQSDVYIYNLDEDKLLNVTNDIYSDMQVSWINNQEALLFVSDRQNNIITNTSLDIISLFNTDFSNTDIYKYDLNLEKIIRLTDTDYNEIYPVASPSGDNIAYISDKSGINNIYITNDNFKTNYPITNVLTGITQLNWNSDSQIAFTGFYKSGYDVFILSNINNKVNVPDTDWIDNIPLDFLRRTEEYQPVNDGDIYKNFSFTDNNSMSNFTNINLNNDFLVDSLGRHDSFKYDTRFTLDYAGGYFSYDVIEGTGQGMGTFIISDILGNHRIAIQNSLQIDFKQTDVFFDYKNLEDRINWGISFYNYAYPTDIYFDPEEYETISYLNKDVKLGINYEYPLSKFHRIEWGATYNYLAKKEERYNELTGIDYTSTIRTYNIFQPHFKYVWDNTRSFYIYAVDGNRTSIELYDTPSMKENDFSFQKLIIDSRHYKEISFERKISFGTRFFLGTSWGRNPRIFGIGGSDKNTFFLSDDLLLNPNYIDNVIYNNEIGTEYEFWSMNNLTYPLRGYNIGQKYGRNAMILNLELRLPFLMYYLPSVKFLGQIFGVIFIDTGVVWNDHLTSIPDFSDKDNWEIDDPVGWIMSFGFGPRFTLFGMPWKLDYAWQYNPYRGQISSRKWYLSIGFDF